jgi:predicted O-linked N-acetylglucosamine transferase (SPINDLY family)
VTDSLQSRVREGMRLQQAGDLEGARDAYEAVLQAAPDHPDALHLSGLVALQLGDPDRAVRRIQRAVDLAPDHPVLRNNLGLALHRSGTLVAAAGQLQKALDLREGYAGAHMNLGAVFSDLGDREGALEHALRAVELDPQRAEAWFNLGLFLLDRVELPQAVEAFRRALELRPAYPSAATSLLYTLHLTPEQDPAAVAAEHRRVSAAVYGEPPERPQPHARNPGEPLRVGYVSGDFRRHAVTHFFEPLLTHHDRTRFHVACYSDTANTDEATDRLMGLADRWCDTRGMDDDALARRVRDDRIDVLVDLSGHTKGNRLGVFARRPAALQLGWLGYPAHPGLETLDGQIVDRDTAEAVRGTAAGRGLVELDAPFAVFRPAPEAPAPAPPPALERGFVTLGSLHKLEKINPEVVACWAEVLKALPNARLLLVRDHLDAWQRRRLIGQFDACGIGEDRLELMPGAPEDGSFHEFWADIDIFLDTFPWSGHTMACHALWCGVPVVTLAGVTHASRMVAGVLRALGCEAWIATDVADYFARTAALARDRESLTQARETLRSRFETSSLSDEIAFARRFETLLTERFDTLTAGS